MMPFVAAMFGAGQVAAPPIDPPALTGPVATPLIYSGNGASQSVTGAGFSPDVVLVKARNATTAWKWVDDVRGLGLALESNTTADDAADPTGLTSFDADGFSLGAHADYNASAVNFLALALKRVAGGFDVVKYNGSASAQAVPHNLGAVPKLILVKKRSGGGSLAGWAIYASPLASPETKYLQFSNVAAATSSTRWNNTAPTSTHFTVGTDGSVNTDTNSATYVAYLFADLPGYVSVGSYTGNGTTTGPTVTTGFRPKIVIVKRTDSASNWALIDSTRDNTSPHNIGSNPGSGTVEGTANSLAFSDTGFQPVTSGGNVNAAAGAYLYLALA